jgi:hypothetical protein
MKKYSLPLIAGICFSQATFAQENASDLLSFKPSISANLVSELQIEEFYSADNPENDLTRSIFRTEFMPKLNFNENFFLDGNIVFEPVQTSARTSRDSRFENEGAYFKDLKLNAVFGPWAGSIGKFGPNFGKAWDYGRGIWGEDFAEDYEITQRIGGSLGYSFATEKYGSHTLNGSTFFKDTSLLTESVVTAKGRTRHRSGGVSNTNDFSSYVFSLAGANAGGIESLEYMLSYRHQARGDVNTDNKNEHGAAATLKYTIPVVENLSFDTFGEYANFENYDGSATADRRYITGSVITRLYKNWNVTTAYTSRQISDIDAATVDDHLFQLTGGYDFGNGFTTEAGYRGTQESSADKNGLGALVRYKAAF